VFPVKYELGFYIPDDILHGHGRENLKSYRNTKSLTPWTSVVLGKLPVAQLLKTFPAFHGTRRFINVSTTDLRWSVSWVTSVHTTALYISIGPF
jgi:hypothetical protein